MRKFVVWQATPKQSIRKAFKNPLKLKLALHLHCLPVLEEQQEKKHRKNNYGTIQS